jgi:hypothetical protein
MERVSVLFTEDMDLFSIKAPLSLTPQEVIRLLELAAEMLSERGTAEGPIANV